jgi:hypothetical protein
MKVTLWISAVVITLAAAYYQRVTGPTYPKEQTITVNGKETVSKLVRSHGGEDDATVTLNIGDTSVHATIYWKHYPSRKDEVWNTSEFKHETIKGKNVMTVKLPHQPPAGKIMYYVEVIDSKGTQAFFKEKPVVVRFKGAVPAFILIPHVIFIFIAMLIANVSGLFAAFKVPRYKFYTTLTLILIFIGGMILGPIVQKYAFNEFWAGVPRGWDLTDNKLLIAFLAWLVAFLMNRKKENRISVIIAALVTLIIFTIPHSMFGSELDRETGKVIQGFITMNF